MKRNVVGSVVITLIIVVNLAFNIFVKTVDVAADTTKAINKNPIDKVTAEKDLNNPLVFIYYTHSHQESFMPSLNIEDPMEAFDKKKNISSVGKH